MGSSAGEGSAALLRDLRLIWNIPNEEYELMKICSNPILNQRDREARVKMAMQKQHAKAKLSYRPLPVISNEVSAVRAAFGGFIALRLRPVNRRE